MSELMLMCLIAGRRAAIPAVEVRSVIEIEAITPIPGTPAFIAGLTALRSQALTVIDSPVALGFESSGDVVGQRAAVIQRDGHLYALVVDEAYDVGEARSQATEVKGGFGGNWKQVAKGMVETDQGPALLVDIDALIAAPMASAA